MPTALQIDWDKAKLLRAQGFTFKQIADKLGVKLGVIAMRASREKWTDKITAVKQEAERAVNEAAVRSISKRAEEWSEAIISTIESQAKAITKVKTPKSLRGLGDVETILAQHIKNGRSMFGLDAKDNAGPALAVGLNFNIDLGKVGQTVEQPAIEVVTTVDSKRVAE